MTTPNPGSASPQPAASAQSDLIGTRPERNGAADANPPNGLQRDGSIEDGKQKARAMLAASGVQVGSRSGDASSAQSGDAGAGRPLSRKRSRSGSRLPQSVPLGPQPITDDVPIGEWIVKEQLYVDASLKDSKHWSELIKAKEQQKEALLAHTRLRAQTVDRQPTSIMLPFHRQRPRNRLARDLKVSRADARKQADASEELVPVRLDLEFDKLRLRDTFTWNLQDRTVSPKLFADMLMKDFQVPEEAREEMSAQTVASLSEQLEDHHPHPFFEEEPHDPHLPYFAYKDDELRVLIKLNITIGNHTLVDQFDWDMNNPDNSPEVFARQLARDMALSGEFMTAIAHSIREQTQLFTKTLYLLGYPFDGRPIEDSDVRENSLASPPTSLFRTFIGAKDYQPYFYELNDADLERTEHVFSREQRQQKRSVNRRGGPALPDLSMATRSKTWRTQVISSVIPGAADISDGGSVLKMHKSAGRKRRNFKGEGEADSDGSEDDDSDPESPARILSQGTTRTRNLRNAASAAQVAMRANFTRSATPELSLSHHETRTPVKRFGVYEAREEYDGEVARYVVKLKLHRERFRQWWRDYKAKRAQMIQQIQQQQQHMQMHAMTPMHTPMHGPTSTPSAMKSPAGSMTPGMTPGMPPSLQPPGMGGIHPQQLQAQPPRPSSGSMPPTSAPLPGMGSPH